MRMNFPNHQWRVRFLAAVFLLALTSQFGFAQGTAPAKSAAAKPATTLSSGERKAAERIRLETIRNVTTKLTSKEFEGRGTGQPGADRAAAYLAEHFRQSGLKPLGDDGTFLQAVKFRVTEVLPETNLTVGDDSLKHGEDFVILPPYAATQSDLQTGLVFAGYGVVSTELKRDDLAGLDLKNKIVLILGGQPEGVDAAAWQRASAPQMRALNIFGRGAAAIMIGNAGTATQPFSLIANYLSRRRVNLATTPAGPVKTPTVLLMGDSALETIFAGSGSSYAQTLEKAKHGEHVSRDLQKPAKLSLYIKSSESNSSNVIGVLEGSDAQLKDQAVVYSAHYDAYGIDSRGRIYPGAADNALGTATITSIAEAFTKAFPKPATRPKRSIIFLAVTGEEYGLLGAEYWVRHPTWPLDKIAADINFDGIGSEVYGPVKRVVGFGAEHSDLGKIFEEVTVATGNLVTPDPLPEERAFVRSDHYAFVKQGVPALMLMGGPEGDLATWVPRMKKWMETDYHSPSDTIKPDWNWTGPQTLAQVGMIIGLRVANAAAMPAWNADSPFNKPRNTSSTGN